MNEFLVWLRIKRRICRILEAEYENVSYCCVPNISGNGNHFCVQSLVTKVEYIYEARNPFKKVTNARIKTLPFEKHTNPNCQIGKDLNINYTKKQKTKGKLMRLTIIILLILFFITSVEAEETQPPTDKTTSSENVLDEVKTAALNDHKKVDKLTFEHSTITIVLNGNRIIQKFNTEEEYLKAKTKFNKIFGKKGKNYIYSGNDGYGVKILSDYISSLIFDPHGRE